MCNKSLLIISDTLNAKQAFRLTTQETLLLMMAIKQRIHAYYAEIKKCNVIIIAVLLLSFEIVLNKLNVSSSIIIDCTWSSTSTHKERERERKEKKKKKEWGNADADFQCCFTSTETIRTIMVGEPRTATSTFTQLLSSERYRN